ncbi:hypothetical protein [Mycobacterium timonense]|uniref:hypothetical protein n=1 Tax=Mycobacterium timonense TaxID=701043 RepID=UPI0011506796|nr:hypothetical protein [Mycobacterium timonense]
MSNTQNSKPPTPVGRMRSRTPVRVNADGSRTMTVQRCCNGCGFEIGDVTESEIDAAIAGAPLADVRDECPWCAPFLNDDIKAAAS